MNDVVARQLKNEPKPAMRPFFATRVAAEARQQRSESRTRWLIVYAMLAIIATVVILFTAPGSSRIAREVAIPSFVVASVTFAFYRRAIRLLLAKYFTAGRNTNRF